MSDFFPQEVIFQILSHLPVETLVKCTSVCKSWHALITSSSFINAHLAKTLAKPLILTRRFTDSSKKEHYFLHLNNTSLDIYQTIKKSPLKALRNLYPRIVELPRPNLTFHEVGPYSFSLGFGFDAKRNDYKVVRLVYPQSEEENPPKVEVFSVKENGWRMVCGEVVKCSFIEPGWTQCFLKGRVHWITYEKKMRAVETSVLLFDMEDEKFRKMKLPEPLVGVNPMQLSISVNRGMLTVSHYYSSEENSTRYCDIWERTQYGDLKSWTKLYTIDVLGGAGRVFGLTETGEVLLAAADRNTQGAFENFAALLSCFEAKSGDLVVYDPKGRQTTHVVHPQGVIEAFYAGDYIESLVFLNKESGAASYEGATIKEKHKSINSESGGSVEHDLEQVRSMMGSSSNDADEEKVEDNPNARTAM
ncbi:hypothetical protein COLO4_29230 [Corchorus olitorius]|uniref:F-box domain-containing protein n=1 Tax=Corchorus olitorius TaxID=93759 RepID=A0A1R3HFQ6_9ROSI|nr:hypothetical protein COLO4_29230 [Corchorus olitorius]